MSYNFSAEKSVNHLVKGIQKWFTRNGEGNKAVIGIRGDKDSAVSAALCVRALGKERVLGVVFSGDGRCDLQDAYAVCNFLGIEYKCVDIAQACDIQYNQLIMSDIELNNSILSCTAESVRVDLLHSICLSVDGKLINTCNYSTKYLGCCYNREGDLSAIAYLTSTEVIEIAHYLEFPENIINKASFICSLEGTAENVFGFTYNDLDNYLRTNSGDSNAISRIEEVRRKNVSKIKSVVELYPSEGVLYGATGDVLGFVWR